MRVLHNCRLPKASATAFLVFCVIAALVPTVASAEASPTVSDGTKETSVCGNLGSVADDGGDGSALSGLVEGSAVSAGGIVAQVGEHSSYDDSALGVLSEHTLLLDQSADVDPVVADGKLDPGCGVAFVLGGVEKEVGAVGVIGLGIDDDSRWLVQGLNGRRGYRMMAVLENQQATKSYTVGLELDDDVSLVTLDNGGAVFVNSHDLVIGSILEPWALDANGKSVPTTQTVTSSSITITVDTSNVTAWPVIADPEYHNFSCVMPGHAARTGTARQYLRGARCPFKSDILKRGYFPQWIVSFDLWRVGKRNGDCTGIPDRLDTWKPKDVKDVLAILRLAVGSIMKINIPILPGVVYDYTQACKAHDYCYDLAKTRRLNYANVHTYSCDWIMYNDMLHDCEHRRFHVKSLCIQIAGYAYSAVSVLGQFTKNNP